MITMAYYVISTYSGFHLHVRQQDMGDNTTLTTTGWRPTPVQHVTKEAATTFGAKYAYGVDFVVLDEEQLQHFVCELDQSQKEQ